LYGHGIDVQSIRGGLGSGHALHGRLRPPGHLKEKDMHLNRHVLPFAIALLSMVWPTPTDAQGTAVLRDLKVVLVESTVIANPDKVKDDGAPAAIEEMLRNALKNSGFEIGESPVSAHILLEEFSAGSKAKRIMVGFGSGRSTVAGRLIFTDADQKELANIPLKVRGSFMFSSYDTNKQQRKQATSSFEQKLVEEIARLK
jgi:hypothetical protein